MKYYKIGCMMGHHGIKRHGELFFYFKAPDMMTAMDMGKRMPAVKHDKPIMYGKEITKEEYTEGRKASAYINYKNRKGR